jgi:hypothetical protein
LGKVARRMKRVLTFAGVRDNIGVAFLAGFSEGEVDSLAASETIAYDSDLFRARVRGNDMNVARQRLEL